MTRLCFAWLRLCFGLALAIAWGAWAQTPLTVGPSTAPDFESALAQAQDVPQAIDSQRQRLKSQREVVLAAYQKQQEACWQKFAVNACLTDARRARRQAIDPLRQQELALNAQERLWRTEQRQLRLQGKQPASKDTP
mgnify:FL=1